MNYLPNSNMDKIERAQEKLLREIEEIDTIIKQQPAPTLAPTPSLKKLKTSSSFESNTSSGRSSGLTGVKRSSTICKDFSFEEENKEKSDSSKKFTLQKMNSTHSELNLQRERSDSSRKIPLQKLNSTYSELSLQKSNSSTSIRTNEITKKMQDIPETIIEEDEEEYENGNLPVIKDGCLIKWLYDESLLSKIDKKYKKYTKIALGDHLEIQYPIQRADMAFLPDMFSKRLSNNHAKLVLSKNKEGAKVLEITDTSSGGTYIWTSPPKEERSSNHLTRTKSEAFYNLQKASTELKDGCIVGLLMKKCKTELLFGFQVIMQN